MKQKQAEPIDVETVHKPSQAIVKHEPELGVATTGGNPLDMEPAKFKAGLDQRKENRKTLMDWIRDALVEGTDFMRIHIVGKTRCGLGADCKNPKHFSKHVLVKPGSEKICGMLGVTPRFPRLIDYEQACIDGVEIKQIILRCEIVNADGAIVAVGVGARNLAQEYGDMNKALKMSEKSAQIDAVLRMGGLSEVFTQDEDDNFSGKDFQEPTPDAAESSGNSGYLPSEAELASSQRAHGQTNPPRAATALDRAAMFRLLPDNRKLLTDFFRKASALLPDEKLEQIPLCFVAISDVQVESLKAAIADFENGNEAIMPFKNPDAKSATTQKKSDATSVRDSRTSDRGLAPVGATTTSKFPTAATRGWMIEQLDAAKGSPSREMVTGYLRGCGQLLPSEEIEELPFRFVPGSMKELRLMLPLIAAYGEGEEAKPAFPPHPEPEKEPAKEKGKAATKKVEVPRDANVGEWRNFPILFGKNAGVPMGRLEPNSLTWYIQHFEVKESFEGRNGKTIKKSAEALVKDKAFRAALDAAAAELGISCDPDERED